MPRKTVAFEAEVGTQNAVFTLGSASAFRRIGLFTFSCLLVLALRFQWSGVGGAVWFSQNLGYYFCLGLVVIWLGFVMRVGMIRHWFSWEFWRPHRTALVLALGVSVFLHLHEPHALKVIYDEPSHALGALVMHEHKAAMMADTSNWIGDQFVLRGLHVSFRPYLFSFLVSTLHDLTGYRDSNIFVLNGLLTPVVLLTAYFLARRLAGNSAGLFAIGLLATLPLLAQVATSGSYDLLNVALIGITLLALIAFLDCPKDSPERDRMQDLGLASALLLSMARAESILYLVPAALAIGASWMRERRLALTWFSVLAPWFLLPNLMAQLILMAGEEGMHAGLRAAGSGYFEVGYLSWHVAQATFYLFDSSFTGTNSLVLSVTGALGFVAWLVRCGGEWRRKTLQPAHLWVGSMALGVAGIYLLVLAQFWSSPTEASAARFILPLLFVGAILGAWLLAQVRWLRERPAIGCTALAVWVVAATVPASARAQQTNGMAASRAAAWFLEFARRHDRGQAVYLERSNYALMAHRFASADLDYLNRSPATFVRAVKAGLYREAVVFQLLEGDPAGNQWRAASGHAVAANVELETIEERQISPLHRARASRLVGFRNAAGDLVRPNSDAPEVAVLRHFANQREWYAYWLSLYP